jgi:hypothetical protein
MNRRAESADARATVIIGFSGALATLALMTTTLATLPGALLAVVAAGLALHSLRPKTESDLDPVMLRRTYVAAPESVTRMAALDRRVANYEKNLPVVAEKVRRVKQSLTWLTISIGVVVLGEAYHLLFMKH